MAKQTSNAAQKTLTISGQAREITARVQTTIDLTDEVYNKLSMVNKIALGIHEKYIGPVDEVVQYTQGFGLTDATLTAVQELLLD